MERIWFTIEDMDGRQFNSKDDVFYSASIELATEYDEYNDAALVAEGLRNCSVIRHFKKNGIVNRSIAGDF